MSKDRTTNIASEYKGLTTALMKARAYKVASGGLWYLERWLKKSQPLKPVGTDYYKRRV
tara:strand:+ start:287 stop:463 length:177 start_codon:yes stop_codon:yes gene_type:complete